MHKHELLPSGSNGCGLNRVTLLQNPCPHVARPSSGAPLPAAPSDCLQQQPHAYGSSLGELISLPTAPHHALSGHRLLFPQAAARKPVFPEKHRQPSGSIPNDHLTPLYSLTTASRQSLRIVMSSRPTRSTTEIPLFPRFHSAALQVVSGFLISNRAILGALSSFHLAVPATNGALRALRKARQAGLALVARERTGSFVSAALLSSKRGRKNFQLVTWIRRVWEAGSRIGCSGDSGSRNAGPQEAELWVDVE